MRKITATLLTVLTLAWHDPAVAEALTLKDLAWMAGHWVGEQDGGRAEEIWMAPLDRTMVGALRWSIPGQMHVLEFQVIEETTEGVIFRFKHFDRNYRAWESEPNRYRLVSVQGRNAVFELTNHNDRIPKRMTYSSPAEDRLSFRGETEGSGKEPLILHFTRLH